MSVHDPYYNLGIKVGQLQERIRIAAWLSRLTPEDIEMYSELSPGNGLMPIGRAVLDGNAEGEDE